MGHAQAHAPPSRMPWLLARLVWRRPCRRDGTWGFTRHRIKVEATAGMHRTSIRPGQNLKPPGRITWLDTWKPTSPNTGGNPIGRRGSAICGNAASRCRRKIRTQLCSALRRDVRHPQIRTHHSASTAYHSGAAARRRLTDERSIWLKLRGGGPLGRNSYG